MERNFNNKVYINPNFKGNPLIQSLSTNCSNKTYVNRHYAEINSQDYVQHKKPSSGKIYLNPNFIQTSSIQECRTMTPLEGFQNDEDITNKTKYKYSYVRNIKSQLNQNTAVNEYANTKLMNNQTSNVNLNIASIPLSKSRYCIVRKKQINDDKVADNTKSSNIQKKIEFNGTSLGYLDYNQKGNKYNIQPSQKVVKVKISKYKTVPISYLNTRNESNRVKDKSLTTVMKCEKHVKLLKTSQYKYTKNNRVSLTNKVTTKILLNSSISNSKSSWQNRVKTKVTKANFRINNIPCRLFTKYGKCLRLMYGNCQYLHDKKHVSLCRKFLKGICHDDNCSLSHELTAKKMPTCYFYLKGMCTKDNCPYVHIKMSENIKICQDFLKGYCERGESCLFRHETSELKCKNNSKIKKQSINKGTVTKQIKIRKKYKKKETSSDQKDLLQGIDKSDVDHRYYKELVTDENICQIKPTRCKLGVLPSFIQL